MGFVHHRLDQANVVAWGNDGNGQTTVPPSVTNLVVGIGAGSDFSLGLNSDGTRVARSGAMAIPGETNVPLASPTPCAVVRRLE